DLNVDHIVESLEYCLTRQSELENFGIQAREFILQNYTWKSTASKLIDLYRNCDDDNLRKTLNNTTVYSS
ncbi:MAG: glycosyltransferase, partial [Pleurocapsa sp.]